MGTDKASLVVDGESMLAHAARVLRECGITEIAIAGGNYVPDPGASSEREGPLAGIVGGWRHLCSTAIGEHSSSHDPIAVLSCDLPAITANVVQALLEHSMTSPHGAVAHDGERPQPLIAVYRSAALDALEQAFERGERSVRRCFVNWDLRTVPFASSLLADADRPEDLDGFCVDWPT